MSAATLALCRLPLNTGMAIAASTAMIATTINISINVKPRFRFIVYTLRNRFF